MTKAVNLSYLASSLSANSTAVNSISTSSIVFPATQVSSAGVNTLDDYEEGSWTPSVGGSSTYNTGGFARVGRYTKLGNIVWICGYFSIASLGSGSSQTVSGLPFTAENVTNLLPAININFFGSLNYGFYTLNGYIINNTTTFNLAYNNNSNNSQAPISALNNNSSLYFTGIYSTA